MGVGLGWVGLLVTEGADRYARTYTYIYTTQVAARARSGSDGRWWRGAPHWPLTPHTRERRWRQRQQGKGGEPRRGRPCPRPRRGGSGGGGGMKGEGVVVAVASSRVGCCRRAWRVVWSAAAPAWGGLERLSWGRGGVGWVCICSVYGYSGSFFWGWGWWWGLGRAHRRAYRRGGAGAAVFFQRCFL